MSDQWKLMPEVTCPVCACRGSVIDEYYEDAVYENGDDVIYDVSLSHCIECGSLWQAWEKLSPDDLDEARRHYLRLRRGELFELVHEVRAGPRGRAMSGDRYRGPGTIHLIRNACRDEPDVWCTDPRFISGADDACMEASGVTCRACLQAAEEYGERAFVRLAVLAEPESGESAPQRTRSHDD